MKTKLAWVRSLLWDERTEVWGDANMFGVHVHRPWPRRVAQFLAREWKWATGTALGIAGLLIAYLNG